MSLISCPYQHLALHHGDAKGFITLAQKKAGRFQPWHYTYEELVMGMPELGEDCYFSQNTFFTTRRRVEHLKQLRALYVDIDCYKLGYSPEWVYGKVKLEVFGESIPNPNYATFSGRGLALVWLLEETSDFKLPLWQLVQDHFVEQFKYVGADPAVKDSPRVLRLAGSRNSKNGKLVEVDIRHTYRYNLQDLKNEYLPESPPKKTTVTVKKIPKKQNEQAENRNATSTTVKRLFNQHTLHYQRLKDLVKLIELRDYNVRIGIRQITCFLYRYWSCCYNNDPERALEDTISLNSQFRIPLSVQEVILATSSAEKAWINKNDEEANEWAREHKCKHGAGYNYSNRRLIEMLEITEEEQQYLSTIISRPEKYKRNNERRDKIRRNEGKQTIQDYLNDRKSKREYHLSRLITLLSEQPELSNYRLAAEMGISESYVRKLRKEVR